MQKIALFFHDSGVSDNITNIIKKFEAKATWYFFASKNSPAYKLLQNKSLENIFIDIDEILDICKEIQSINPDFIFVGTSWQNKTHINFIHYAKQLSIPSVAFMEHWVNYKERFGYPAKNWEDNKPDFITVNDIHAYTIAKKCGFKNIIQLKFYTIINDIKKLKTKKIDEKNEVLFISEPTKKVALNNYDDENYWGFNEFDLVENIAQNLKHFQTKNLKVRLHPSDEVGKYNYLYKKYPNLSITIEDPYKTSLLNSVVSSKIIIGIDGFVLYFAKVLGKYSISYIPNNKRVCAVPIFKQNHIQKLDNTITVEKFQKKNSIKKTQQFGISFIKMLKLLDSNKKLNAAIIGCGNIGGLYDNPKSKNIFTHAHAYILNKNTTLTSCCDLDISNISHFKKLWGKDINDYNCVGTLLEQEKPTIVSLASSTNSHYSILKQLLQNKHVKYIICEKPFVSTLEKFNEIETLVRKSNKNMIINFIRCFDPSINKVKNLIKTNKLGTIVTFNGIFNKGIYHNGSHMLSLIEHMIDDINSIQVFNKEIYEDDIYGNFIVKLKQNIVGTISNFNKTNFSTFELNIILENGTIEIKDSGFNIIAYKTKESKFKGIKQLQFYKKYPNSLREYAKNSLNFLLTEDTKEQLDKHLAISKKLLKTRDLFLENNNTEVIF